VDLLAEDYGDWLPDW